MNLIFQYWAETQGLHILVKVPTTLPLNSVPAQNGNNWFVRVARFARTHLMDKFTDVFLGLECRILNV